ncbi:MAG: stage 0 sporulation family protein [Lagierella massiliensis]|nr:stage 0 sporulation family protein [Lagierella massiliensis]
MVKVVGVRFKKAGKVYYFDPNGYEIELEDPVIVETARGIEYGNCVKGIKEVHDDEIVGDLKPVLRIADETDKFINRENIKKAKDAFYICKEKINEHKLDMKLVDCEYTFDNNKVIFYFTSDDRVDFRELVRDLASIFRMRIELRQIGVRDHAKIVSGLSSCGQECCCGRFLSEFAPVSIKMAKDQSISLNPTKISGMCGRLMCCLKYEQEGYEEKLKRMPKVGTRVTTNLGKGEVIATDTLTEFLKVKIKIDDENEEIFPFHLDEVKFKK